MKLGQGAKGYAYDMVLQSGHSYQQEITFSKEKEKCREKAAKKYRAKHEQVLC